MRYRHQPVIVIPKAKVNAFNAEMLRHGYGPNFASVKVIGKGSAGNTAATHYAVECPADDAMLAAIRLALKAATGAVVTNHVRPKTQADKNIAKDLDKAGLKQKSSNADNTPK